MKKTIIAISAVMLVCVTILAVCLMFITGQISHVIEGTEKTFYGTVYDHALSPIDWDKMWRGARAYITVVQDSGEAISFWLPKEYDFDFDIGDYVKIESGTEAGSGLVIAYDVSRTEEIS